MGIRLVEERTIQLEETRATKEELEKAHRATKEELEATKEELETRATKKELEKAHRATNKELEELKSTIHELRRSLSDKSHPSSERFSTLTIVVGTAVGTALMTCFIVLLATKK